MFVAKLESILPSYSKPQGEALKWLAWAHSKNSSERSPETFEKHFSRFGCAPDRIAQRCYENPAYGSYSEEAEKLFATPAAFPMSKKMKFFEDVADQRMQEFYEGVATAPSLLVHVSCTGYVSPSAAQKLLIDKGWNQSTNILHAYHMGCYAALPSVRSAVEHLRGATAATRADIVHAELCTLHMDPLNHTPEQIVVQSLFADGHIRYEVSPALDSPGLEVLTVREELLPNSLEAMTWRVGGTGFQMSLSRDVPEFIKDQIGGFFSRMWDSAGVTSPREDAIFAIHPGGPRIIDMAADVLRLQSWQTTSSRKVLSERGNMSSATLPHIWKEVLADANTRDGQIVVSFAFGPGLTIFGSVMRVRK
jgi:predicted naringenin-chalcone synthase